MTRITPLLTPLLLLLLTTPSLAADTPTPAPAIFTDTKGGYKYHGCYNETTGIAGTSGARALYNGKDEVKRGEMTVCSSSALQFIVCQWLRRWISGGCRSFTVQVATCACCETNNVTLRSSALTRGFLPDKVNVPEESQKGVW